MVSVNVTHFGFRFQVSGLFAFYQQDYRQAKDDAKCVCDEVVDIECAVGEIELDDFCSDGEKYSDDNKDEYFLGYSFYMESFR